MLRKPAREAMMRGLNRLFYSMLINSKTSDSLETDMLSNLNKKEWHQDFKKQNCYQEEDNEINRTLKSLKTLTAEFKN